MSRPSLLRVWAMAVAFITLALSCTGGGADAAPSSRCVMTGGISGPNPAYEGDNVSAAVSVTSSRGTCDAGSVRISAGPGTLCSDTLSFGSGGCSITFQAFRGLSTVMATLSTGQSLQLGTFTVLSRTPTTHASSPRPTRTITVVASASSSAASSSAAVAAASRAAVAAASSSRAAARRTRTSTVTSTAFPSDTAPPSSADAVTTDAPPTATASASGFAVNVRTDPTGGSSIPSGPLLLALLVLAAFVAAAARLIYTHSHEELEA